MYKNISQKNNKIKKNALKARKKNPTKNKNILFIFLYILNNCIQIIRSFN